MEDWRKLYVQTIIIIVWPLEEVNKGKENRLVLFRAHLLLNNIIKTLIIIYERTQDFYF